MYLKKFLLSFNTIEFKNLHKWAIDSIDLSPSSNLVVSAGRDSLLVWNARDGALLKTLEGHLLDVLKCRFFPSGLVVLSGGLDMTVRVFSVETGQCARTLMGHRGPITDLGIIDKGVEVMSSSKDGTVKRWNCGRAEYVHSWDFESGDVNSLSLTQDANMFVVGTRNGEVITCDQRTNEIVHRFNIRNECTSAILVNENWYAGTKEGEIVCFDLKSRTCSSKLKTSRGSITKLKFTPQYGLISSFSDGTVAAYPNIQASPHSSLEFTGADCDPIYDFSIVESTLFTSCRDKIVRKYNLANVFD
uniref:Uncharacterized protein n=1 Tax=Acrobeloides nanus TaxID=290746 RepID=A0A914E9C7_9BILA